MKEISDKNISDIKKLFGLPSGKKIQLSGMYEALRIYDKIKISKREENKNYNGGKRTWHGAELLDCK